MRRLFKRLRLVAGQLADGLRPGQAGYAALTKNEVITIPSFSTFSPRLVVWLGWLLSLTLLLWALAGSAVAQPLPPDGKGERASGYFPKPYSHYSDQEPVAQVLGDFARFEGFRVNVSQAVTGVMSGRFENVPPDTFLKALETAFGVRWYLAGGELYFYHESEWQKVLIHPQTGDPGSLYRKLNASAVVSPQLPISSPAGGGVLTVSGPASYVEMVRQAALALEGNMAPERQAIRVFKLRYASADDTTIRSSDRDLVVPGVASLLRAMMSGEAGPGLTGRQVTQNPATMERLLGHGLVTRGQPAVDFNNSQPAVVQTAAGGGGQPGPSIVADTRINGVIIQDFEYRMPYYEQVIADLDRPAHLVEIHAAIVDIDTDFKRDLGISYQGSGKDGDGWAIGGELSQDDTPYNVMPDPGYPEGLGGILSTVYTKGEKFFIARVRAMETRGNARMLGRPSVLTTDNLEATLENTTTYYVAVSSTEVADLFRVEAGTVLRVTPHIIESDQPDRPPTIRLIINVQDNQESGDTSIAPGSGMALPPIKQTKINTQALVAEGQSILIGGYYFEQKKESVSGVPVLMDIPVLGHLFKSRGRDTQKMERLILITPRVIRLGQHETMPSQLDEPSFERSPTQADYEPRLPAPAAGGCLKR